MTQAEIQAKMDQFVGKTIQRVQASSVNFWVIFFTDGTSLMGLFRLMTRQCVQIALDPDHKLTLNSIRAQFGRDFDWHGFGERLVQWYGGGISELPARSLDSVDLLYLDHGLKRSPVSRSCAAIAAIHI